MKTAIIKRGLVVAVLFTALAPIACGSDSDGGGARQGDTDNKGDSGPPPSTAPPGSVACGEKNCVTPEGVTGMPCCMDHFASACGILGGINGSTCVKAPAPEPPECPKIPPIGGFVTFRGCCTSTNICGVDTSMFGGGCTDYATFKSMAAMYSGGGMGGMFMITLPDDDPACTQPPSE